MRIIRLPHGVEVSVDSNELAAWLAAHGPDNKALLESTAFSTKRDNYGLVGKAGKKAKKNDGRWAKFQEAVKP